MTSQSEVVGLVLVIAGVSFSALTGFWLIGGTLALVGIVILEFF